MLKYIGDFRNLKKFWFEKSDNLDAYGVFSDWRKAKQIVIHKDRRVQVYTEKGTEILYDLITSGLVKKVVEE